MPDAARGGQDYLRSFKKLAKGVHGCLIAKLRELKERGAFPSQRSGTMRPSAAS